MHIIVVGAGAAGLVAAAEAAKRSARVTLLEKNPKTGVKILMSGGTRCNLTQNTDARGITKAFGKAGRFLQPSVGGFPPDAVVEMFSRLGVPTKIESTGKIFPQSDRALHVRDALHQQAVDCGVQLRRDCPVRGIAHQNHQWNVSLDEETLTCDRLIITSGGKSWPGCGTTGDAYDWLRRLGHTIVPPRPALVPLVGGFPWTHDLSGITLDNVVATVRPVGKGKGKKELAQRESSWLFTHFGFSGPAAMDVSGAITAARSFGDVRLTVDLVPSISHEQLQQQFQQREGEAGKRRLSTLLSESLPKRVIDAVVGSVGDQRLTPQTTLAELSSKSAHKLAEQLKRLELPISGTKGFEKAEVTAGGVALNEVDSKTMASRLADGLYIAGEVLDVDGPIGGFNFQAAFSTGRAAAIAATETSASQSA